jgi:beta-mannanase
MHVAMVAKCLNLRTRWATQIARAIDYTAGNNDLGYYTNGNIMFLKLIGFELGAWATGDPVRRQDVETLWWFTVSPTEQQESVGNLDRWRGCGYIEESPGKGYFSETTTTGNSIDHTGTNRLDWIYTDAQANYAGMGYLLFGDQRYLTYAKACIEKMRDRYNFTTGQFVTTGGSRNPGVSQRNIYGHQLAIAGWIDGHAANAADASTCINLATNGMDADYRNYLNTTHVVYVRGFAVVVGASIVAAHCRTLQEPAGVPAILTGAMVRGPDYDPAWVDSPWDLPGAGGGLGGTTTTTFETNAGKQMSIIHIGWPWILNGAESGFPTNTINLIRNHGSYPLVDWSPWQTSPSESYITMDEINAGDYDDYIRSFATTMGAWGHPIFLRPMHEMNGTWFTGWSPLAVGGPTAAAFISAWKRIYSLVKPLAPRATFVWCPNVIRDQAGNVDYPIADLYPGDDYVDWVGLDGYAWGSDGLNLSFTDTFQSSYDEIYDLADKGKPLMLAEWGCDDDAAVVGGSKAAWITDAFEVLAAQEAMPRIRAIVWFNRNADGELWRIEDGSGAAAAHAAGISDPVFLGAEYGSAYRYPIPAPSI